MNEFRKDKPTSEQLVDLIDDELDITICSDVVHGLDFEYKQLQQQNQKYKEVIDKLKEWEQTHTILVYTKEAPRQLVGTHELLHLLYDEDKEVE